MVGGGGVRGGAEHRGAVFRGDLHQIRQQGGGDAVAGVLLRLYDAAPGHRQVPVRQPQPAGRGGQTADHAGGGADPGDVGRGGRRAAAVRAGVQRVGVPPGGGADISTMMQNMQRRKQSC